MVKFRHWRLRSEQTQRRSRAGQIHAGIQRGGGQAGQGRAGQAVAVTAKILGVPTQTLGSWARLSGKGQLKGAGDKPVSAQQMELARLRAELSRVKMERDILKKATAYFARESL